MDVTIEAIIEKIETSYADLVRLYRNMPVSKIIEPGLSNGWSVKDLVAHLAAWEGRCASLLQESHTSDTPLQAEPDVAALNHETYYEHQALSWEEVQFDAHAAHRDLIKAIRDLPADRLDNEVVRRAIAAETWEHYAEHLPELEQWQKQVTQKLKVV